MGGMDKLATPEVGILGWRAGMPGWMVGGPGASVIWAKSSFVVLLSICRDSVSVFGCVRMLRSRSVGRSYARMRYVKGSLTIIVTSARPMTWNIWQHQQVAEADER